MDYFLKIIKTSRPLIWVNHFTFFIYGGLQDASFHFNSFQFILGLLIFSLPFSLFIYAINDYYDLKTDLLNPRKGTFFGEKHDPSGLKDLRIWGFAGLAVSLILAIFMGMSALITMIILSILLYSYSALPLRLKSVPVLDTLSGGYLYAYLVVVIGYFSSAGGQAQFIDILKPPFIFFGLFGLAIHLFGAVVDIGPDREDNIKTSAVFFGVNKIVTFCIIIFLICLYLARSSWFFVFFMSFAIVISCFYYSEKWRRSLFFPNLVAYMSLVFLAITILLYLINPNLLRF